MKHMMDLPSWIHLQLVSNGSHNLHGFEWINPVTVVLGLVQPHSREGYLVVESTRWRLVVVVHSRSFRHSAAVVQWSDFPTQHFVSCIRRPNRRSTEHVAVLYRTHVVERLLAHPSMYTCAYYVM